MADVDLHLKIEKIKGKLKIYNFYFFKLLRSNLNNIDSQVSPSCRESIQIYGTGIPVSKTIRLFCFCSIINTFSSITNHKCQI